MVFTPLFIINREFFLNCGRVIEIIFRKGKFGHMGLLLSFRCLYDLLESHETFIESSFVSHRLCSSSFLISNNSQISSHTSWYHMLYLTWPALLISIWGLVQAHLHLPETHWPLGFSSTFAAKKFLEFDEQYFCCLFLCFLLLWVCLRLALKAAHHSCRGLKE